MSNGRRYDAQECLLVLAWNLDIPTSGECFNWDGNIEFYIHYKQGQDVELGVALADAGLEFWPGRIVKEVSRLGENRKVKQCVVKIPKNWEIPPDVKYVR